MQQTRRRWGPWALVGLALVVTAGSLWRSAPGGLPPAPGVQGADEASAPPGDRPRSPSAEATAKRSARRPPPPPSTGPAPEPPADEAPDPAGDTGGPLFEASEDGMVAAIRSVHPNIGACFDAWRATDGAINGRIDVLMVIGQDTGLDAGAEPLPDDVWPVARVVTQRDALEHPMLELCVKNTLSGLVFVPPEGPLEGGNRRAMKVPFVFNSGP